MKCNLDRSKLRNNSFNRTTPFQVSPTQSFSEGKTNIDAIKQYALNMLKKPVMRVASGMANHPFVPTVATPDKYDGYINSAREQIAKASTPGAIYSLVTPLHLPMFFNMSSKYLSLEDYSKCLATMWKHLEFPNTNAFVGVEAFIEMFKKADKTFLMDEEELEIYNNLPEEIVVYRGINEHGSVKALSWSLDKEQAEWFANRFEEFGAKGALYQANIKKEYVLAYFSREQEAVIDFTKATNIEKIG